MAGGGRGGMTARSYWFRATHMFSVASSGFNSSAKSNSCFLIIKNPELDETGNKFSWKIKQAGLFYDRLTSQFQELGVWQLPCEYKSFKAFK